CSSNGCGAASNTRRSICTPTTASAKLAPRSAATSSSTISVGRMRALTAPHPIKPTSLRCRSAWQPNLGRGFTYRCGKSVQTTGTTSIGLTRAHLNVLVDLDAQRRFEVQGQAVKDFLTTMLYKHLLPLEPDLGKMSVSEFENLLCTKLFDEDATY